MKKLLKLIFAVIFGLALLVGILEAISKNNEATPTQAPVATESPTAAPQEPAESKVSYVLDGIETGEYGKKMTFSAGEDGEYSFIGYFLPAGDYTATNANKGAVQISFYTEGSTVDNETGIEYPADGEHTPVVVMGQSEKDFSISDGEYLKLSDDAGEIMISAK